MATPEIDLVTMERHEETDLAVIDNGLAAFNQARAGADRHLPLAVLIKDTASGATIGGLWGDSFYDWLFIKMFFIPDSLRGTGVGRRVMAEAERVAATRGCAGIWLDTFEFQARGFYEKLGFSVFGTLPDHPRGMSRFFLAKRLDGPASRSPG
jgi:GNAT superfamily N-acetyltransferase